VQHALRWKRSRDVRRWKYPQCLGSFTFAFGFGWAHLNNLDLFDFNL
jgi:hypothetical protein